MDKIFTPAKLWAAAICLLIFDAVLIYLFINQPTVLSLQDEHWDFRIQELRQVEQPNQATPSAQPTTEADANGQVL